MPVAFTRRRALTVALTAAWAVGGPLGACDRPPAASDDHQTNPVAADPTEPLRPAAQAGTLRPERRVAQYELHAQLDAPSHQVTGTAVIRWTNRSRTAVNAIPMQLYLNGFRAEDTAWMREGRLHGRTAAQGGDHPWGYIDVQSVQRVHANAAGEQVSTPLSYAERKEPSLMDVQLDAPLPPGQTAELSLAFVTQLPRVFARSGYARTPGGDFFMVAQWYPKPAVLDADGRWHEHPFTFHSEFFADFADFDVTLDVPASMTVGATGTRVQGDAASPNQDADPDARRVLRYRAAMVHDFAWVAAEGVQVQTTTHDGILIRQILSPERVGDAPLHLDMVTATLDHMQRRFTPYPWSTLTVVHPPRGAESAGGMEYPTLFTTGDQLRLPPGARALGFDERYSGRYVSAHELGHQWFQGLLASNEYAQPWLDEGLNSFSNLMVYFDHFADDDDEIAGEDVWVASVAGRRFSMGDGLRLRQQTVPPNADISDQPAAAFSPEHREFGALSYRRPSAWMATLRAIAGRDVFDQAMRRYAERFRFGHPQGHDLEATLIDALGPNVPLSEPDAQGHQVTLDVAAFLEQALRTTATVDFEIDRIRTVAALDDEPRGFHRIDGELVAHGKERDRARRRPGDGPYEGHVVVRRRGDFVVPVVIEVHTDEGTERFVWDGKAGATTLVLPGKRVHSAVVDPDGDLYLEGRRLNNTAFARGYEPVRPLAAAMGDTTQAAALVIMGGLGP